MIPSRDEEFARIEAAIRSIRFGEVRAIIQGGIVVQLERVERVRPR